MSLSDFTKLRVWQMSPSDFTALRMLVEAAQALQDGAPSGYRYFEASAFFEDLKMLFTFLPDAREAVKRLRDQEKYP